MAPPQTTGDQFGDPQRGSYRDGGNGGGAGSHSGAPFRPEVPGVAPYGDGGPLFRDQQSGGPFGMQPGAPGYGFGPAEPPFGSADDAEDDLFDRDPGFHDQQVFQGRYEAPGPDRLGFDEQQPGGSQAQPSAVPAAAEQHAFGEPEPAAADFAPDADDGPDEPLVRPYAMTGGRTRPRYQLAIEALVSATGRQGESGQLPEHQRIVALCRDVKSVAEISALLSIPLGVARILVADLAEAGLVAIHQPGSTEAGQPDVTLLERVLSGLRKL